jgi:hypothetical protein
MTTNAYIHGVKQYGWPGFAGKLWQRNYWERVVRDEKELKSIREYIQNNPAQWEMDKLHPDNIVQEAPIKKISSINHLRSPAGKKNTETPEPP